MSKENVQVYSKKVQDLVKSKDMHMYVKERYTSGSKNDGEQTNQGVLYSKVILIIAFIYRRKKHLNKVYLLS